MEKKKVELLENCRSSIGNAAKAVADFFKNSATLAITRDEFKKRGRLVGDRSDGAVYVYFDAQGDAVYVGETGRHVKSRLHDQTSAHKNSIWWKTWTTMRFLPMSDNSDRLIMETLLITSLNPKHNVKPGQINVAEIFKSMQPQSAPAAGSDVTGMSANTASDTP
jgi:hypothetical protein